MDAAFNAGAAMAMQFAMDTLQMALHQSEGWGYDRIMRITYNWVAVQREYKPALDCRNPEADVDRSTWIVCWRRSSTGRQI